MSGNEAWIRRTQPDAGDIPTQSRRSGRSNKHDQGQRASPNQHSEVTELQPGPNESSDRLSQTELDEPQCGVTPALGGKVDGANSRGELGRNRP